MRILLISLTNIGDVVLTTPVLEALHHRYPTAQITMLVGPRPASLFEQDPRVAQVLPYDKTASVWRRLQGIARLARTRWDLVVDLRRSLLPLFLRARRRSGLIVPKNGQPRHRAESHLDVLRRMGIPTEGVPSRVIVGPEDEAAVTQWLRPKDALPRPSGQWLDPPSGCPLIAVAPGARSHLKRWTAEGLAAVCDALMAEEGAQVILVGDQEDQAIAAEVMAAMRQRPMDLTGRTSLRQLAALFARVQAVLTNDSACLHLACAVRTPVVAIFGPTDPLKYGPTGPSDRVVRLGLVCSPCERALCPYGRECMRFLTPRDVLAAVRQIVYRESGIGNRKS